MHEMSLCEGVLDVIEDSAKAQNFKKVSQIFLEIGNLSGVEIEAMKFCFAAVMRDSIADKAKLTIIKKEGLAWCMKCAKKVKVKQKFDKCPDCGSYQLQIVSGDEMKIKELEVE
ncbi:MAG: hydrogenase maturation nickel metallochaperone HypA [Gammaproteobacteria bacterium]|nr:MAG: hydrogenase maturation nickel metallochaperone HypA [Gammaproteobacteria bacterium]